MERVGRPTLLHTQVVLPQLTQAALYTHASVRSALEGCRPDSTNLAAAPCRRGQVAPSLRGRGDLRQSQHAAHAACIGRQYVSAAVVHLPGQVRSGQVSGWGVRVSVLAPQQAKWRRSSCAEPSRTAWPPADAAAAHPCDDSQPGHRHTHTHTHTQRERERG